MKRAPKRWREPELCRGCRGAVRPWLPFCDECWWRLPVELRGRIAQARVLKAPHLVSAAVIAAVAWLKAHSPAALVARVTGERE